MRLLSLFALSAFLFGANLSAYHDGYDGDKSEMTYKDKDPKNTLKKMVFMQILLKNGVDKATAHNIFADMYALKAKIKHKIKKVLKAALHKHEYGNEESSNKYRLKKMVFKQILAKHGVDGETADNIMADLKQLKMKIKHKIRNILEHASDAE